MPSTKQRDSSSNWLDSASLFFSAKVSHKPHSSFQVSLHSDKSARMCHFLAHKGLFTGLQH